MTISRRLGGFEFFRGLSARERSALAREMSHHELVAGEHLFHLGQTGDAAYFVIGGEVSLYREGVLVARRGAGDLVGEFALIDESPRSASARIDGSAEVVRWPRAAFSRALLEHPSVGSALYRLLTMKLREDVEAQVAHGLEQQRWRIEMSWAREVQSGLLPPSQGIFPGVELACVCEPAGEVGGDLYDYREVRTHAQAGTAPADREGLESGEGGDDGHVDVGVLVGDVTGHGMYSALVAAMAKSCFHNQADLDPSPSSIMRALAKTVELSVGKRLLASAAYVVVGRGGFVYANAGHPDIVHVQTSLGRLTRLGALDPILGALPPSAFPGRELRRAASPGDFIVMYSDGLTEAVNPQGELFGMARLGRVLAERPYTSAGECRDRVLAALTEFRGPRALEDDLTVAVLRIL